MSKKSNFIVLDEASTICGNWFTKHPFMSVINIVIDQSFEFIETIKTWRFAGSMMLYFAIRACITYYRDQAEN